MNHYFLDTNICIYFLKGNYPKIKEMLKIHKPNEIKIASIVKAELLYGAEKSRKKTDNLEKIHNFLVPFEIIPFDNNSSYEYAKLRVTQEQCGKIIGPNDLILAASVLTYNGILVTNNDREFKRIKNLKIENWTK